MIQPFYQRRVAIFALSALVFAAPAVLFSVPASAQSGDEIPAPSLPQTPRLTFASPYSANPTSARNAFYGSVTASAATDETIRLTLDEAISRGLKTNLGLKQAEAQEKAAHGQRDEAVQLFLPTISLQGSNAFRQTNLAALGFGPSLINKLAIDFPGLDLSDIKYITRADVTEGVVTYRQTIFSGPVIDVFKAAGAYDKVAYYERMRARGEVVQQVATAYLRALAAQSELDNARSLETTAHTLYDHAHEMHVNGVAANLDELRAKVEWLSRQQQVTAAESAHTKALILLKREIGIAPGQAIALTDPMPTTDLTLLSADELRTIAYQSRQDYQKAKASLREAEAQKSGYSHQRWPTLSFNGRYAATAVNGAGTHGNFAAIGEVSFPVFREASLRGDVDVAAAELRSTRQQLASLTDQIDQQLRAALLDCTAAQQLVQVAESNLDLAHEELTDESARYDAGVDDNLPLTRAQSSLAAAEANLIESRLQYNLAKLQLSRSAGVLETQYRAYLGK